MTAIAYVLQLLQLIKMAIGAGLSADPYITAAEQVLQADADANRDVSDEEIAALDAQRHSLEEAIRNAAN